MTSKKQIAANRKNAKKGGVKSDEGKQVSKMNAYRHGILSRHLYFSTGDDDLSHEDFLNLQIEFYESMQPVGIIEQQLVDRLFATFWRMQRLYIAETGYIRLQLESQYMQHSIDQMEENAKAKRERVDGFFQRMRTSHGCLQLADGWQAVLETIKEKGLPLGKGMTKALDEELGGHAGFHKAECVSICNHAVQNKENDPMDAEEEKRITGWAIQYAEDMLDFFRSAASLHEIDEREMQSARKQSLMIPPMADLEKMQRYDAHLQRVMMQTLHELQRVQSKRLGHPAPLAAAVDVTLDSENGFV